jgi:hypothetical protein
MASVTQNIKCSLGMAMALDHQALAADVVRIAQNFDRHVRMIAVCVARQQACLVLANIGLNWPVAQVK